MKLDARGGFSLGAYLLPRIFKFVSALAIGIVLFLVVVLFLLNHLIEAGEFRGLLIRELEERTHLKVSVGAVEMELGGITGIALKDFSLSDPISTRPVLTAPKVVTRIALLPLWNWQIVVQDLRFYQPALQIYRNQEGKVDFLEILGRVLFQKPEDFPFTLDLREIKMEGGRVSFRDEFRRTDALITELRQADLSLRRVSRNALLDVSTAQSAEDTPFNQEQPAVDYHLQTVVEREGKHAEIASHGRITFEGDQFQLRQARLDADFQAEKWPAGFLQEYYRDYLPWSTWSGTLNAHFHLRGNVSQSARLAGGVVFRDLKMELDQTLAGRVSPGNGRLELEMDWQSQEVRLARLQLTSEEIGFAAKGTVSLKQESDPYVNLQFSTPFLPIPIARGYLPRALLESSDWQSLLRSVDQGEVRVARLELNGPLSNLRGLSRSGSENLVKFDAQVRRAAAQPSADYLPVRNVSGQLSFEKGILYFKDFAGSYGQSRLENVSGSRRKTPSGSDLLEARVQGEADLGELYQQARNKFFPQAFVGPLAALHELSGKAAINLTLRADSESLSQVQGQIALVDTMLRSGAVVLKDIRGQLNISPSVIATEKIVANFAGSPVTLRGSIRDYASATSSYDITAESSGVSAGEISHLFFGSGSVQDPGTVRGWLRYRAAGMKSGDGNLSGVVELHGIQPPIDGFRQPLRQISGVVSLDGNRIELQAIKGNIGNFGLEFSGQLRLGEKPSLSFTLTSPEMDIAMLLPKGTSSAAEWYDRLRAQGKVRIARGRFEGFHFSNLGTDLVLERRLWRLENFSAGSAGGKIEGRASFFDRPAPGLDYVLEPKIEGVPVQEFLGWFDMGTREVTGAVNLSGKLESSGASTAERKRNMNGQFQLEIQDGLLRRMPVLLRILNLMDLTRWFSFKLPDLNQQGIRFRKLTGDIKVAHGVYSSENLFVDSDDIGISGSGQYDAPNDTIDAIIALRPFPKIGSVVSYIPLIGPGIAGIQGSILVASFHVKGPVEDATITPAPLSTLSEFFFSALKIPQKMLTLPGSGTK